MSFAELDRRYRQLLQATQSGQLSEESFLDQVSELTLRDDQGQWWMIGARTGKWYVWQSGNMVEATPPGLTPPSMPPPPPAAPPPPPPAPAYTPAPPPTAGVCPHCGEPLTPGGRFCGNCGQDVTKPSGPPACPNCGAELELNARFCGNCGHRLTPATPPLAAQAAPPAPLGQRHVGQCCTASTPCHRRPPRRPR